MSVEIIKTQIQRFLRAERPEVLAIKGAWGVGKTYSWKEFLKDAQHKGQVRQQRYSYVSLFGVDSLDELKFLVFQQAIPTALIGENASIRTFRANAASLSESMGRKFLGVLRNAPYLRDFSSSVNSLAFLSLNDHLICIDDLERKGKNLGMRDVLGMVAVLKEEKQCNVALIHNDGSLGGVDLEDYRKYREKVIDIELFFDPTAKECADIALSEENDLQNELRSLATLLGINNIRILKKIQRLAEIVAPLLEGMEQEVVYQALHSLCLLSWCFYGPKGVSPDFEYVKKIGHKLYGFSDDESLTDEEKRWNAILQEYNYLNTDEMDLEIARVVETGYVVRSQFYPEAKKLNDQRIASKGEKSFTDIWRSYHDSFDDNEDEVVDQLVNGIRKHARYIAPHNLGGTARLLRGLGRDELANELIDDYIESRKEEVELFNLENYPFFEEIGDSVIIEKFKRQYSESRKPRSLAEVLAELAGKDGWNAEDEEQLAQATVEDYYDVFTTENGEHLSTYVNKCLQFARFANSTARQIEIAEKAAAALRKIAAQSPINAMRVKKYGISIDPANPKS